MTEQELINNEEEKEEVEEESSESEELNEDIGLGNLGEMKFPDMNFDLDIK